MTPKPLLVFDFDGTLADTFDIFMAAYNEVAPRYKLNSVPDKDRPALQGQSVGVVIRTLKIPLWKLPFLIFDLKRIMRREQNAMKLFPGIKSMLRALHAQGIEMGILSFNRVSIISSVMDRVGLIACFSFIKSERNIYGKHRYLRHLRRLYPHMQIYYVGDQITDIESAQKAGVMSIAVSWGFNSAASMKDTKPDYFVQTPKELAAILVPANK